MRHRVERGADLCPSIFVERLGMGVRAKSEVAIEEE
jgi:hypothetical protein